MRYVGAVPFAPLRLVSVGLDGKPPRLVRGDADEKPIEYATLSHCWGNGTDASNNEGDIRRGLPRLYL